MNGLNDKKPILFYERKFYCFSNFSAFAVEWRGVLWMTSEHAYQAAKFDDKKIIERVRESRSADEAKKVARINGKLQRNDWEDTKLSIMGEILRAKLSQHSFVQKRLSESGDREIIEDSHKDSYWGWGPNKDGENHLGKLWMEIRDEVRSNTEQ